MNREQILLRRIKLLTGLFVVGLVVSGATAIPLQAELHWLVELTGARQMVEPSTSTNAPTWAVWLVKVQAALQQTSDEHSILFYGTDWLAFGHFVIAIAFIGALRDPVRNRWIFDFGLIACVLVIPYAFIFGGIRGIPIWWRSVDCSFGVFGFIPLWLCRKWVFQLNRMRSVERD
jgi:hypothetical protein